MKCSCVWLVVSVGAHNFHVECGSLGGYHIYIYATPPKDLPKSMPSEIFLATFIPTVQIMMTQTGGGHVKTCTYPGFTQMFQTGQ